jgi:predicted RNase H-like nuclease
VRALGIDVGVAKGLDLVVIDERRVPLRVEPGIAVDRLGRVIGEVEPDVIAIDSPPSWATSGGSRLTERQLLECNIHSFNTPAAATGRGHRFYAWMETGFRVFRAAEKAGFPRYGAGEPGGTAMEVFPHATATVLAGCLRPKAVGKRTWRARVLSAQGVPTGDLRSGDLIDAGLCALTGLLALQGKHFAPGDPKEGVIVLPVVTLPATPYRACTEQGPIAEAPLFRFCACGDPDCNELTRSEFAPGHDAKRKSMLWRLARDGRDATDELRRRGWALPPEVR